MSGGETEAREAAWPPEMVGARSLGEESWAGTQAPPGTGCVALGLCTLMVPSSVENVARRQSSRDNSGTHPAQGGPEGAEQRFPPSSLGCEQFGAGWGQDLIPRVPGWGVCTSSGTSASLRLALQSPLGLQRVFFARRDAGSSDSFAFLAVTWLGAEPALGSSESSGGNARRGLSLFVDTVGKQMHKPGHPSGPGRLCRGGPASCSEPGALYLEVDPCFLAPVDTCQLLERDLWFIQTKVSVTDKQPLFAF